MFAKYKYNRLLNEEEDRVWRKGILTENPHIVVAWDPLSLEHDS